MSGSLLAGLLRSLRPQQWTKNLLVLAAPVAAGLITEPAVAWATAGALVAFCGASSATYLLNDVNDREADRRHPTKCNRPIARGTVSPGLAVGVAVVLLVASLASAFAVEPALGLTLLAYLVLTTSYTVWLKHLPVVDLVAVAAGFVLRAIAGGTATGVPISEWFFIVTSFGALLMVTGKREGELAELGEQAGEVRATLRAYTGSYLASVRGVASAVVLVGYCLWAFDAATRVEISDDATFWLRLSILPFTVAILRYAQLLDAGRGAEPEKLVLSDRTILVAGACWAIIYGYGVYLA